MLAFGAGVGFCFVGVSARTLETPDSAWQLILEPSVWAILANGFVAAVLFAVALQKTGAAANTAMLFISDTVLSWLIGVIYLDDRVRPGFTVTAIVGFVCAIAGAVGTAHYASIARRGSDAMTHRQAGHPDE